MSNFYDTIRVTDLKDAGKRYQRRMALKIQIRAIRESIKKLIDFSEGKETLKEKGYSETSQAYQPTADDKKRLPHTLNHLKCQVEIMKKEIEMIDKVNMMME